MYTVNEADIHNKCIHQRYTITTYIVNAYFYLMYLILDPAFSNSIEFNLIKHLLTNYSINVRPAESVDVPVTVHVGMAVNQLIDMVST